MPSTAPSFDPRDGFVLHNAQHSLITHGVARRLFCGSADALATQAASVLHDLSQPVPEHPQAPGLLVGGLPFRRDASCHLFQPARQLTQAQAQALLTPGYANTPAQEGLQWQLQAQPSRTAYAEAVAHAVQQLHTLSSPDTALQKVVLARSLLAESNQPIALLPLLQRLRHDASSTTYLLPLPADANHPPAHLIGASPELLLSRHGRQIASHPLAGSVRRHPDASTDAAQVQAMQDSAKEQHEHRLVVEAIADLLAPLCRHLHVPALPGLHATASMWHLGTRIEGELREPDALDCSSSLALAALLHPTPAVCGTPRDRAYPLIDTLEPVARGFFTGAVGWCDPQGNGAWYVAIRCAQVQGHTARLFAGAGIVADSIPAQEAAETRAKFNAMLHSLDLQPTVAALERDTDL